MITLNQMITNVQKACNEPVNLDEMAELLNATPPETRWAIEDETTRNELEELVILTAMIKFYEARA